MDCVCCIVICDWEEWFFWFISCGIGMCICDIKGIESFEFKERI